jgi:outer membrane lipoprotein-sorting protein
MKSLFTALALLPLTGGLLAQEGEAKPESSEPVKSEKAIEILKKADAAAREVKAVEYDVRLTADRGGELRGHVLLAGELNERTPSKYMAEFEFKQPQSEEMQKYTVGANGETYFVIDPAVKKVYEDIDPAVLGTPGRIAAAAWMIEYLYPTPFEDELNGEEIEFQGTTKVEGEECYQIRVKYSGLDQSATWYFSTGDYLPRRVLREVPRAGKRDLVLSNVKADPQLTDDAFAPRVPEGFEKTDDFAP